MRIYRFDHGIYRCINNPADHRGYVMLESEGCYPTLMPIQDMRTTLQGNAGTKHGAAVPIHDFTNWNSLGLNKP